MTKDVQTDVLMVHDLTGSYTGRYGPRTPPADVWLLRLRLLREEAQELEAALYDGSPARVAQEAADLIYVTVGTLLAFGIDLWPVWEAVQASNVAKAGGPRRPDGKFLKPPGWVPPDVPGIIARQGPAFRPPD